MKASAGQIGGLLDRPNPATRLYLFHGPDEAGAMELSSRLARALGQGLERVDIEAKELRGAPGRLADEAASLSLFGDKRYIRVTAADDYMAEAVTLLLNAERTENPVVVIGPGLKTSAKLVKAAIAAGNAVAFACYIPEGAEAVRLAANMAREQGVRLSNDAARRLAHASGGDRAVLGREIEKLALYVDAAPERPREADEAALDAIGADLSEAELSSTISVMIDGRVGDIGGELAKLQEAGTSAIPLLRQLVRRLMALAEMRAEVEDGATIEEAMEKQRVFFREKPSTARALKRWTAAQLARAIDRARATERAMMRSGSVGEILAEAECVTITRAAHRAG